MVLLNDGDYLEWQVYILRNPVRHHIETTVRRYKRNTAISVELAEPDALVELDVVDLDAFVVALLDALFCVLRHYEAVINTELAFRHASQLGFHSDFTVYIGFENCAYIR